MRYEVILEADDNGTLLAAVPAFPEIATFGESAPGALAQAQAAIEEAIAARIAEGADVPEPGAAEPAVRARLPWLIYLKTALYNACRERRIARAELVRPPGWNRKQAGRLFKLDRNSRLDRLEGARRAIGPGVTPAVSEVAEPV